MTHTQTQGADGAGTMTNGESLDLRDLHAANIARQAEWCPDQVPDLSFRGNELGGECGEAQNVIKKLERERQGWRGSRATKDDLADELADVVICADLCAVTADIDLGAAVRRKFNGTSEKQGLSVFLPTAALASPRTDSAASTAGEEPWTFDRTRSYLLAELERLKADLNTIGEDLTDDQGKAVSWLDVARGRAANVSSVLTSVTAPAPSSPGVPDSVREASSALLNACMADMGPLDEMDRDDEPVGMSGFGVGTAVTFGHLRRLEQALATHSGGQSAGSGAEDLQHVARELFALCDEISGYSTGKKSVFIRHADEEKTEITTRLLIAYMRTAARALSSAPAPATPPGVPDSLRALSEAASEDWDTNDATPYILGPQIDGEHDRFEVIARGPHGHAKSGDAIRKWQANRMFAVAAVNHVRAIMVAQPAGQAGDAGAEEYQHPGWKTYQRFGVLRTPNSTRTGAAETEKAKPDPIRLMKEALFACLSEGTYDRDYGGVLVAGGKKAWLRFSVVDAETSAALAARPEAPSDAGWRERVRHVKRGTEYEVLHRNVELQIATHKRLLDDFALAVVEGDRLVIYQGADGKAWAREEGEFDDGRFETITPPSDPAPSGQAEG